MTTYIAQRIERKGRNLPERTIGGVWVDETGGRAGGMNKVCGALVVLAILLALGVLAGCGGGEEESGEALSDSAPLTPEEASSVTIRISGTEGTAYLGDYGSFTGELQPVEGTFEAEPTDYEVEGDFSQGVTAFFRKTEPGGEKLKVEIIGDDQTIMESTTYADLGEASLVWLSSSQTFDEPLPGDLPPEGELPPEEELFEGTSIEERP